jgi:hypothetical protein
MGMSTSCRSNMYKTRYKQTENTSTIIHTKREDEVLYGEGSPIMMLIQTPSKPMSGLLSKQF